MAGDKRSKLFYKMTRTKLGKEAFALDDPLMKSYYWTQSKATETVGDAAANGTSLLTITVTAAKVFHCMSLMLSTNIGAMGRIGTGALGAMTDYYIIDVQNAGSTVIVTEDTPIFTIDNSTGTSDLTLRLYIPQTAKGVATNNAATKYFDAYVGGILI